MSYSSHAQIRTYDTTFDGWNAIVTEDLSLHGNDSAPGIVFFPGIGQQTKNINDLKVNGPHYLISNGMWDGSVQLGNGVHHPFIISLQPPGPDNPAMYVKPKIDAILARYRIKRKSFYMTGLSLGGWQANMFVTYQPTPGDHTYGNMVRAIVNLEGVEPADYTGIYAGLAYPGKMGDWAKNCGGREIWVEGQNDWRAMEDGATNMIDAVKGSASYFQVTYGGGAHCCWNTEYTPGVIWTKKDNKNISKVTGDEVAMNVWQWLLRQGDTSLPGNAPSTPAVVTPAALAPTANAGQAQTVTLPTNSVNLDGSGTVYNGATVSTMTWTQTGGPNSSKIKAGNPVSAALQMAANLVGAVTGNTMSLQATASGLVEGSYTFQLTVKDNNGKTSNASVSVTVHAAAAPSPPPSAAPNVSAGGDPEITLPVTTVTLSGTAAGSNGAKIAKILWQESQGPVNARIASPSTLSTAVSGLTAVGTYIFRLTVTDKNGKQAASTVQVVVKPAASAKAPPTVNAGANQTITLPTNSATLNGKATGKGGAVVNSYYWTMVTGPTFVKFSNAWAASTEVSGMGAGIYVYQLSASDNNGQTSTSTLTITVNTAKGSKPSNPSPGNGEGSGAKPTSPPTTGSGGDAPPTVNAGKGQVIMLPTSSTTLNGVATGNDGATVKGLTWKQVKGPVTTNLSSPASISTEVTGLTEAGQYVYMLTATDSKGKSGNGSITVTVAPAPAEAPTVSAGQNQTITLPTSSLTLKGVATGHNGAVVNSYFWNVMSGPSWVKFGNEWAETTTISGLVAGTYVFRLSASDDRGETTISDPITVTVKPVPAASATGETAAAGDSTGFTGTQAGGSVIYPNPVHDLLNIRLNNELTGKVTLQIFNARGSRLHSMVLDKGSLSLETSVDVSRLTPGIYVVELMYGPNMRTIEKFIKQ
jgi:hypothetical protein